MNAVPDNKWSTKLQNALGVGVVNVGHGGAITPDFLSGGDYESIPEADVYVVALGLNDSSASNFPGTTLAERVVLFKTNTETLIEFLLSRGSKVLLLTAVAVDFPDHYNINKNVTTEMFNQVYRDNAEAWGCTLVDAYSVFLSQIQSGVWDHRIRDNIIPGLPDTDPTVWGPASPLDGNGFGGPNDPDWYTNIHYNSAGSVVVNDTLVTPVTEALI